MIIRGEQPIFREQIRPPPRIPNGRPPENQPNEWQLMDLDRQMYRHEAPPPDGGVIHNPVVDIPVVLRRQR